MLKTLSDFLDSHDIRYTTLLHSTAYTAQEIAQIAHVHGDEFGKVVMVKIDGKLAMAVIPAQEKLDTELLAAAVDAKQVDLAGENEFQGHFPKCEIGAMPPIGNLFDMDVYLDEELAGRDRITFNAGSHTELIQMRMLDYITLANPKIVRICNSYV